MRDSLGKTTQKMDGGYRFDEKVDWGASRNSKKRSRMPYVVQPRRNGPKYRLDQRGIPLEVRYARRHDSLCQ
jgi:hypothetical protein